MTNALDRLTNTTTAFATFEALCKAGSSGYAPTMTDTTQGSLIAAFNARMAFEGCSVRAFVRSTRG